MRISTKASTLLGSFLMTAAGLAVAGSPSSLTEQRGFDNCVKAAEREGPALDVERTYYTNTFADSRTFYLNARTWADGETQPVRITCETSRSGHRVLAVTEESGRYVGRTVVNVAQN